MKYERNLKFGNVNVEKWPPDETEGDDYAVSVHFNLAKHDLEGGGGSGIKGGWGVGGGKEKWGWGELMEDEGN